MHMKIYCQDKTDVAQYVEDILRLPETNLRSITITSPGKSGDCYVLTAIGESLEGIVEKLRNCYDERIYTSTENIPVGWFLLR